MKDEPEFLRARRLKAYRHWLTIQEPAGPKVHPPPIAYQNIIYFLTPKPKSLSEVDPKLLEDFSKPGISLRGQERQAGVAADAVFDSVSVATTFKAQLAKQGVIFCSFSEAVRECLELVRKLPGSVAPCTDNFFTSLSSAVFSDGTFCYIPKGVGCPMELAAGPLPAPSPAWRIHSCRLLMAGKQGIGQLHHRVAE